MFNFKKNYFNFIRVLIVFLVTPLMSFAGKTSTRSAVGFEKFINFIVGLKEMAVYLFVLASIIFFIFQIFSFMANQNMQELIKLLFSFAFCVAIVFAAPKIIVAIGANIEPENIKNYSLIIKDNR